MNKQIVLRAHQPSPALHPLLSLTGGGHICFLPTVKGWAGVGRSPAGLRETLAAMSLSHLCAQGWVQRSCFLQLLYHPWSAKPPAVCTKQPVAPSFCPLLTKMLLQLGMGAVPDRSMLTAAQMGKSCSPVESQLAGPRPCVAIPAISQAFF